MSLALDLTANNLAPGLAPGLAPADAAELAAILAAHHARRAPLRILGGGSRVENDAPGTVLDLSRLSGVVTWSPAEMTLIARPGTPLPEIEAMLAGDGQMLAFEPPDMRAVLGRAGVPTLGGAVAANAAGPRRLLAGAARDHLLGVRLVDGQGRMLKSGGRVMKNVTGLDLSRLQAGAHGTLGVLVELALKTRPLPAACATLGFPGTDPAAAAAIFAAALATPCEVSGAAWQDGTSYLRIEGLAAQLAARRDRLLALFPGHAVEVLDAPATVTLWRDLRDLRAFAGQAAPLWRIPVRPGAAAPTADALRALGGRVALDWGGGLIWYCGPGRLALVRAIAPQAVLIRRGGLDGPAFPPAEGAMARLSDGLRRVFDPAGILNPGLMGG